jgi:hypothetical protein
MKVTTGAMAAVLVLAAANARAAGDETLAVTAGRILAADYGNDQAALGKFAAALAHGGSGDEVAYRRYWRGFALWRKALNAMNETPPPASAADDARAGIASFREALVAKPDWIEAQIGITGCAPLLLFLAVSDVDRQAVLKDFLPTWQVVRDHSAGNPRALWEMGQSQLAGNPRQAPDPTKARELFRQGVDAALVEARAANGAGQAAVPRWGGAENLMNLAYLHTHTALKDRDLATAYAEGALVAAPNWHYVRDILWPKIQELPARP